MQEETEEQIVCDISYWSLYSPSLFIVCFEGHSASESR